MMDTWAIFFEGFPFGLILMDKHGVVLHINPMLRQHLELPSSDQMEGKSAFDYLQELPILSQALQRFLEREGKGFDIYALRFRDKFLSIHGRTTTEGVIITTQDVTNARRTEMTATNALLEGQEEERRRLAKEIHDGIGPLLSTIKLYLDALHNDLQYVAPSSLKKIQAMGELIRSVASDLRDISHALMPSVIFDFGLITALENLCRNANESEQVQVNFFHTGIEDKQLDPNTELGLFRIAQELLSNGLQHSRAKTITLQLLRHPESIVLMVEDDGIGFNQEQLSVALNDGMGLRNVLTRAKSLGGNFTADAQPGKGMLATIEIPA